MKLKQYTLSGQASTATVSDALFGSEFNLELVAQAVRVYRSNQRQALAKTKTRGEVDRTTAKVFKQKHTGNARHGARSAPIYVGGGIAHGPRGMQQYKMTLPKQMARTAVVYALSAQAAQEKVAVIADLQKISGKVKDGHQFMQAVAADAKSVVIIADTTHENVLRSLRNVDSVQVTRADRVNALEVASADVVLVMDAALSVLEARLIKATKTAQGEKAAPAKKPAKEVKAPKAAAKSAAKKTK